MKTEEFFYDLPEHLIAQTPLKDRSSSKLLLLNKDNGNIKHTVFKNIIDYIDKNDVLVFNNTRVLPARLYGIKKDTGAHVEILLLKRYSLKKWQVLVKPAKRLKKGSIVSFGDDLILMNLMKALEM